MRQHWLLNPEALAQRLALPSVDKHRVEPKALLTLQLAVFIHCLLISICTRSFSICPPPSLWRSLFLADLLSHIHLFYFDLYLFIWEGLFCLLLCCQFRYSLQLLPFLQLPSHSLCVSSTSSALYCWVNCCYKLNSCKANEVTHIDLLYSHCLCSRRGQCAGFLHCGSNLLVSH